MEASPVLHRFIFSALLSFAILWLCAVRHRYVHTALAVRQKLLLLLSSCALNCVCGLILFVLNELQVREEGRQPFRVGIEFLLRCSSICMIIYQSILLWHCSHYLWKPIWSWVLHGHILLPSLLEIVIFIGYSSTHLSERSRLANFETCLRNYSTSFQIFFFVSSFEYAAFGTGWFWVLSASTHNRWRVIAGVAANFTIAISSLGVLMAGLELERLQALFLKVFILSMTFLLCSTQSVRELAVQARASYEPSDRRNGQASIHSSNNGSQNTPPSRRAESDSTWDMETVKTYTASISGGKQTDVSLNGTPSMPPLAKIDRTLESHGRISADSGESGADDWETGQLWLHVKVEREAKEEEAYKKGMRVYREIRARCNFSEEKVGYVKGSNSGKQAPTGDQRALSA